MYFSKSFNPNSSDDSYEVEQDIHLSEDCGRRKPKFKFPPPPRLSKSATNSYCSTSDSSNSGAALRRSFNFRKKRHKDKPAPVLPPLGIYWDIENCQVPKNKSATAVVQRLREMFLENYRESEFVVVCDVKKENSMVIHDLHDAQVMVIHVSSTSKNAADDKLRQSLRRFGELHPAPACVVLISGDINFAADLSDLRYRKKVRVKLVHNVNAADALILCANEHYSFTDLMKDLPENRPRDLSPSFLTISNLPQDFDRWKVRTRLRKLIENCGGKIIDIHTAAGTACLRFGSCDAAQRAQRRIDGEDVYGRKIKAVSTSIRNISGQRLKHLDLTTYQNYHLSPPPGFSGHEFPSTSYLYQQDLPPPPGFSSQEYPSTSYQWNGSNSSRKKPPQNTAAPSTVSNYMFRPMEPMEVSYDHSLGSKMKMPHRQLTVNSNSRIHKTSGSSEFSDEGRIWESESKQQQPNQPVDLIISNLDPTIHLKELQRLLTNMIKKYAMILHLKLALQLDGSPVAYLRVNSLQEAQFAISQLHKQKLGNRRIVMAFAENNLLDKEQLKAMVVAVLQEVPEKCLPLFQFIDLLESKYHCVVSVSDLNKLKDICKITDDLGTRTISLLQKFKTSSNSLSNTLVPYCTVHCPNGIQSRGWCEIDVIEVPSVMISLRAFSEKLSALLNAHMGCMPLLSFQACYEQEFYEPLPIDVNGVPLEHLVLCVPNIEIKLVGPNKNIKMIKMNETLSADTEEDSFLKSVPPSLVTSINLFCRELVDLLKKMERCQLLFRKFIPAYHHHYGKQCRVADYGYTRLIDLLESLVHVVQLMGDGTRRIITLSHSAQMRRFTIDLLKLLKVQPSKQITLTEFPGAYEKVMGKPFSAVEYGLCTLEDLLGEVSGNTIVISESDNNITIAIPKREQTAEEILRTKQFATEVIHLLRHSPYYTIPFNKFVPAYHHHFGQQCRLSDYGFTKLIDLFEAIPDVVKIEEMSDGERSITLTQQHSLTILASQIVQLIKSSPQRSILLSDLAGIFLREYGYPLKVHLFDCDTVEELVAKLSENCMRLQVINSNAGPLLVAIDLETVPNALGVRCWSLLMKPPNCKKLDVFHYEYQCKYNSSFSMENLKQISHVVSISTLNGTTFISLTSSYILAAEIYQMIYCSNGAVAFSDLEKLYMDMYGKKLDLPSYNINSVDEFFNRFNMIFFCKGGKKKSIVILHRNLAEHMVPLPPSFFKSSPVTFKDATDSMVNCLHELFDSSAQGRKKISPPKPDTPPTPEYPSWNSGNDCSTPVGKKMLSIQMPIVPNPQLVGDTKGLVSPAQSLMPFYRKNPWTMLLSPDPTELPMPDKLMGKSTVISDDSADSGVNTRLENSPPDDNEEGISSATAQDNKKPSFATVLNFNY